MSRRKAFTSGRALLIAPCSPHIVEAADLQHERVLQLVDMKSGSGVSPIIDKAQLASRSGLARRAGLNWA